MEKHTKCGALIRENYYVWDRYMGRFLANYNLNLSELSTIEVLYDAVNMELTYKQIEEKTKLSQTVVVRMLKELCEKGYIVSCTDETDRRAKKAILTKTGKQLGNMAKQVMISSDNSLLSNFSQHERIQFERFLGRSLRNSMEQTGYGQMARENEYENKKTKVLIIDDEEINRDLLRECLQDEYDVVTAKSGKEALECLSRESSERYGMILLDLYMPKMSGFEFLEIVWKNENMKKIPIIVITSELSAKAEERCFQLGVKDFIRKPFRINIIKRRVHNMVEIFHYQQILERNMD